MIPPTVREYSERCAANLAFASELLELYPEAFREDHRWFARRLSLEECDVVEVVPARTNGFVLLVGKRLSSGGVVYLRGDVTPWIAAFPEGAVLEALLAFAQRRPGVRSADSSPVASLDAGNGRYAPTPSPATKAE